MDNRLTFIEQQHKKASQAQSYTDQIVYIQNEIKKIGTPPKFGTHESFPNKKDIAEYAKTFIDKIDLDALKEMRRISSWKYSCLFFSLVAKKEDFDILFRVDCFLCVQKEDGAETYSDIDKIARDVNSITDGIGTSWKTIYDNYKKFITSSLKSRNFYGPDNKSYTYIFKEDDTNMPITKEHRTLYVVYTHEDLPILTLSTLDQTVTATIFASNAIEKFSFKTPHFQKIEGLNNTNVPAEYSLEEAIEIVARMFTARYQSM